jgi:hypothetical protein
MSKIIPRFLFIFSPPLWIPAAVYPDFIGAGMTNDNETEKNVILAQARIHIKPFHYLRGIGVPLS